MSAIAARPRSTFAYLLMLVGAAGLFLIVASIGDTLPSPTAVSPPRPEGAGQSLPLYHVLLALAVVIATGRLLGVLFTWLGQPPVIGEVAAGILLGPSFFGWLAPHAQDFLFPASVVPYLGILAQIGIIFYLFLVGVELDGGWLREQASALTVIAHAGIAVPFVLGATLGLWLYPTLAPSHQPFLPFALFLGVSLSVTAFPVLARILTDRGIDKSPLGVFALSCAALGDATAWCLLAVVVGVVRSQIDDALLVMACTLAFVCFMLLVVRPLAAAWARRHEGPTPRGAIALTILGVLLSAAATEGIGIHALFGAFLFGAVFPHDTDFARDLCRKLESPITILLLPAFFAYTGLRTNIGLVAGWEGWLVVAVIIVVATLGKFGGTLIAARLTGKDWRTASALGVLMNTRGLMELIVLNVGLDLGVISETLFTMLVLMALVTTVATTPLLQWLDAVNPSPTRQQA